MNVTDAKNRMTKDTLLYLPAKAVEGIVGILTISIYTRFFSPNVYGYYNLITTTVNILCVVLLWWLIQSGVRYVNTFNSPMKMKLFYSTSFAVWGIINGTVLMIGVVSVLFLRQHLEKEFVLLIFASFLLFVSYNTSQMFFSIIGTLRLIKLNLMLSIFSVTARLILTTFFVYLTSNNHITPISAVLSNVIIDCVVVAIVVTRLKIYKYINLRFFSRKVMKRFLGYGIPIMGVSLTMSFLNLSDRYVITFSLGAKDGPTQAGIYAANYSIASAVFNIILIAVMRGVYPMILKTWKKSNLRQTEELLGQAVRYYLMIALPAATGLSILSGILTRFLDSEYHEGSFVTIWVAFGMFLLGLTEYSNKAWELTSKTGPIFRNSLISCAFNLVSNLLFIPLFGYMAAAVNTTASYLLYLCLSLAGSRKIMKWRLAISSYVRIVASNAVMAPGCSPGFFPLLLW